MNKLKIFALAALALMGGSFLSLPDVGAVGFGKESFEKQFYFAYAPARGSNKSGMNASNEAPIATNTTLWAIPANTLISKVFVIVDTAVTGTSAFSVGDTDGATSYVPAASITLGTPGMYAWSADKEGAYLQSATVFTGPSPLPTPTSQVLPAAKYYSAAGKYLTVTNTTTNTAGRLRVVVQGYNVAL